MKKRKLSQQLKRLDRDVQVLSATVQELTKSLNLTDEVTDDLVKAIRSTHPFSRRSN